MSKNEFKDDNERILAANRKIEHLKEQFNRMSIGEKVQGINQKTSQFLKELENNNTAYQSITTFFNQAFETLQEITNIIQGFRDHPEESLSALNRVFDRTIKDLKREGGKLNDLVSENKNEIECVVNFIVKGFTQLGDFLQNLFQEKHDVNTEMKTNFDTVKPTNGDRKRKR